MEVRIHIACLAEPDLINRSNHILNIPLKLMSTHYRLYPPFLYVQEEQNFSDTWERFCCSLLNLNHKTDEIYVRNPPEQGVDLYYPSSKIAYQCKSIESGKSGDFNVSKAIESINAARAVQNELGWEKYVLCVNVTISGSAEKKLKESLPNIEIMSESRWVQLCGKFYTETESYFRKLVDIPRKRVYDAIGNTFISQYSDQLKAQLDSSSFDIFLFSNQYDKTFRVSISDKFTVNDLLEIFRHFFRLPKPAEFYSEEIRVSLSHSLVFNGRKTPLNKTLQDVGITQGDIVTYWTTMVWKDLHSQEFNGDVIHMIVGDMIHKTSPKNIIIRKENALRKYSQIIYKSFNEFENTLS